MLKGQWFQRKDLEVLRERIHFLMLLFDESLPYVIEFFELHWNQLIVKSIYYADMHTMIRLS